MSLVFSNSTTKAGIVELIDANVKTDSTSYAIEQKTRDINLALDKAFALIFEVGGTWQFDDSNQSDYPIISTNLVSGQRDYSFTTDGSGNLILDIYKVFVKDSTGTRREIFPVDVQQEGASTSYTDGLNITGLPTTYDKTANGIFLDPIPNYNSTLGLEVYISREGSYFSTTDTTKKAGFAGLFHEYLALRPSYFYALRNGLPNTNTLKNEMLEMEQAIMNYYKAREKDVRKVLKARRNNSH